MVKLDDTVLLAYVDGELDTDEVQEIEAALAADEEARRTVELFRKSSALVRTAFDESVGEPVPERLRAPLLDPSPASRLPKASFGARRQGIDWQPFLAIAASVALLAVGFAGGTYFTQMRGEWNDRVVRSNVADGPKLAPAALPRYTVGEAFSFSDGRRETVYGVEGESVTWRTNTGSTTTRYHNFLIPPLAWETPRRRSDAVTDASPHLLWPLKVGKNEGFEFRHAVESKAGRSRWEWARSWQCSVDQTELVKVIAGTFETYRIQCNRYGLENGEWRQTRTYYYAPTVGHYVLREDRYPSRPSHRIELVSAGFNSTALARVDQLSLNAVLQETLNQKGDGDQTVWRSGNGRIKVTLTPVRTYRSPTGITCREYTSFYDLGDKVRTNSRRVCPDADGVWRRID